MKDYYAILDVAVNAEPESIRKRYRLLVVAFHPDKFTQPSEKAEAEEKIKEINEAYGVLVDPAKRARYDRSRTSRSQSSAAKPSARGKPYPASIGEAPQFSPDHLHYEFHGLRGDELEVSVDRNANVILLDDASYQRYLRDCPFRYIGGFAHVSPIRLAVPHSGIWHLVIDNGGYSGRPRAAARIRRYW